jgi:hypothetical protein
MCVLVCMQAGWLLRGWRQQAMDGTLVFLYGLAFLCTYVIYIYIYIDIYRYI